jgi:hypothetical protein
MKITKQARAALFVMLAAISILPGCGKNKNEGQGVGVIGVGVPAPIGIYGGTINGGCTNLLGATGAVTLYFSGNATFNFGSINGVLQLGTTGIPAGYPNQYVRTNGFGDSATVAISGNTAYAQVTLAPITVQTINSGGGTVCGLGISSMTIVNGNQMAGGLMGPIGQGGGPARASNGSPIYL